MKGIAKLGARYQIHKIYRLNIFICNFKKIVVHYHMDPKLHVLIF